MPMAMNCSDVLDLQLISLGSEARFEPYKQLHEQLCKRHRSVLAVFLTIGPGPSVRQAVHDIFTALAASGLLHAARHIFVNAHDYERTAPALARSWRDLLPPNVSLPTTATDVPRSSPHNTTYEFPTLQALLHHCAQSPTHLGLYMHTKGSTYPQAGGKTEARWRRNLIHFTVTRYRDCVRHLTCGGYSTCGPNLDIRRKPQPGSWLHYSGNFFWARCDLIRRLPPPSITDEELADQDNWSFGPVAMGRFKAESWLDSSQELVLNEPHLAPLRFKSCWGQPMLIARAVPDGKSLSSSRSCRSRVPPHEAKCS